MYVYTYTTQWDVGSMADGKICTRKTRVGTSNNGSERRRRRQRQYYYFFKFTRPVYNNKTVPCVCVCSASVCYYITFLGAQTVLVCQSFRVENLNPVPMRIRFDGVCTIRVHGRTCTCKIFHVHIQNYIMCYLRTHEPYLQNIGWPGKK